ncbi:MarR family transcriptional regulator [Chromatiales bacterium (ex Bugula neritina AB1)]|nr:MarR family transcriptional regulator [Chromatiales bacterium (ex Bugula neritina AB1)]
MIDLKKSKAKHGQTDREAELRQAIELLFFSYRAFTRGPDQILAKRGLNRQHHRILYFVGRAPGLSVKDLLQVLDISKQALHMPLRQLVSMGLISNDKSLFDGRVRELRLTDSGKRLEARLTGTQLVQLENVFSSAGSKAETGWRDTMEFLAND